MNSICVYCGSNSGGSTAYADAARELARTLVDRNISLVYGGASVGLMGSLASEVMNLGGSVTGVIPKSLTEKEIVHRHLTELIVTPSMHERKQKMADLADGFIAMPGGIGTLEELFEVWTWGQLGFHQKPCGLLNVDRYFDSLLRFLDHSVDRQFVKQEHRDMLIVEREASELIERFEAYTAPDAEKWHLRPPSTPNEVDGFRG